MNRRHKGIIYSLITLILLMPLLFFLVSYLQTSGSRDELSNLKIRGIEISNFANSVSEDVPRILKITAKRALISAINEIDMNGTPLDDAQFRIVELMLNATLNGTNSTFMNGSSLEDWASRMEILGTKYGFSTNITFLYLNVSPYDSFSLEFQMVLFVNATDPDGMVSIMRTYNISYLHSIEGLEDPLYPLSTNGFVKRIVKRSQFNVDNVSNCDIAIANETYMSSNDGASFFDRMENKTVIQPKYSSLSPNTIGLESFANVQRIAQVGVPVKVNQTVVDHLYFNGTAVDGCTVVGSSYSWFRLDLAHNATYNVSTVC
ncbi:MAG: hypothetical protein V1835_00745 [Candidatus Micrarchaeota archaeon]